MAIAAKEVPALQIGNLKLRSRVLIAPMVGITDAPFRRLAHEFGAGLISTEMVPAEGLVRRIPRTLELISVRDEGLHPVAVQLVGCEPEKMAEAAKIACDHGADVIDVNLGCPVPKVAGKGSGAGLARDINATAKVLDAIVHAVNVPVTAKMRLGWDHDSINAPQLSKALQDVGVRMVAVHGRTRAQKYTGNSDWNEIAKVKDAVSIPVIGSGDVENLQQLGQWIDTKRFDGVVVARAALGNLWFIRQAVHFVATGELLPPLGFTERIELTRRHLELLIAHFGERRALKVGRKYVAWTIRGCNGAARLRNMVQDLETREDLNRILDLALGAGLSAQGWFHPVFTSGEG